jgi:hypothetical protein
MYAVNSGSTGPQGPQGPAGAQGPQGVQGVQGTTGPQGAQGPIGLTGAQGPQGIAGANGATGPQGPIGLTGSQGPAGTNGTNGTNGTDGQQGQQGIQGVEGPVGPQGPIGLTGPAGPNGANGLNGTNGTDGQQGIQGVEGPIGLTGPAGPQGVAGANGIDGATGPQGIAGTNGTNGIDGATGPQGIQGEQGPIGPQGIAGTNGVEGVDGAQGPQGPQGPIGLTGPQGAAGTQGIAGANGLSAYEIAVLNGYTGTQQQWLSTAIVGPQGPQGPQGIAGTNGSNGVDGANGPQGPQGIQGPQGVAGINGINGTNGLSAYEIAVQNGYIGTEQQWLTTAIVGPQGPAGTQGEQGVAGINGTNGIDGKNTLINTSIEPSGTNCTNGGTKIEIGLDTNSNGILDLSEVNLTLTKYICNSNSNQSNTPIEPITNTNPLLNGTTVTGLQVPNFMNYYGNGALGNHIVSDNELINNNSMYNNLTIPLNTTALINQSVTTIIYVKDTLYLYGTISGRGQNRVFLPAQSTTNHVGATASSGQWQCNSCGGYLPAGNGNQTYSFSWTANQQPSTYFNSFGGTISKGSLSSNCFQGGGFGVANYFGENIIIDDLIKIVHFGLDISGANGYGMSAPTYLDNSPIGGGAGGGGLYVVAKNIVLNGTINLSGGDGGFTFKSNGDFALSAGGGSGSCIIRTTNIISNQGTFIGNGGSETGGSFSCYKLGGNGSLLIIN